jgi:hypothetical protein
MKWKTSPKYISIIHNIKLIVERRLTKWGPEKPLTSTMSQNRLCLVCKHHTRQRIPEKGPEPSKITIRAESFGQLPSNWAATHYDLSDSSMTSLILYGKYKFKLFQRFEKNHRILQSHSNTIITTQDTFSFSPSNHLYTKCQANLASETVPSTRQATSATPPSPSSRSVPATPRDKPTATRALTPRTAAPSPTSLLPNLTSPTPPTTTTAMSTRRPS